MKRLALITLNIVMLSSSAYSQALNGSKELKLVDNDGSKYVMGTVVFSPEGETTTYSIEWNDEKFSEHFLSMRPFKCVEGPGKNWCRVPYPYEIKRKVSTTDLIDLEYDTLFVWKGATEYGINMWNGVYYKMEMHEGNIVGKLHEIDMGILAVPPDAGNLRPVGEFDIEAVDKESHWLPTLIIE